MDEFDFIAEYLSGLAGPQALDLKDDAAVWTPPPGMDVVISTDTLVEGIHFPLGQFDASIAKKLLAVNVSDLTAKGAEPVGYFLNLSRADWVTEQDIKSLCDGLNEAQSEYGLKLWGGDTTKTVYACVLSVTMLGLVPCGQTVLRSGAQSGDIVAVTGTIGDAYLGLKLVQQKLDGYLDEPEIATLLDAYHDPKPPHQLQEVIQKYANAAIDISDGLIADAGHISTASKLRLKLNLLDMPISKASREWLDAHESPVEGRIALATGGDDYQVLLTIPPSDFKIFSEIAEKKGYSLTKIGTVSEGEGVDVLDAEGNKIDIKKAGYTHF